jgi:hypothetical protein
VPQDTDILNASRFSMVGLGVALQSVLGSGTYVDGLACTPGTGLSVNIGPGAIYSLAAIDDTAYGSLAADTVNQIVKQGLAWGQTALTPLSAPGTAGQSVVWLIEAKFQEVDGSPVSLPYYNSANPSQPLWTANNTVRQGICALQAKQGTPAATGSQVAPSPDAGWTPLYTVTVAYGASSIAGGNIAVAANSPFLTTKLPGAASQAQVQSNGLCYAADTGAANAYAATYSPAVTVLSDGMVLEFKATNANTGAATFSPNGLTAKPIVGGAHAALQGGEIVAGGMVELMWHATLNSWVLLGCTGGALQVCAGTQSQHAVNLAQIQSLVAASATTSNQLYFMGQL